MRGTTRGTGREAGTRAGRRAAGLIAGLALGTLLAGCASPAASPGTPSPSPAPTITAPPTPAATATPSPTSAGSAECERTTETGGVAVVIQGFAYDPDPVRALVGQPITWTNRDGAPHSATLDDIACTTDGLGKDGSGGLMFTVPGTYRYHCRIHPDSMRGTIEITG